MSSHDVFCSEQLTKGMEDACTKAKRIIKKDGYDALIFQKIDPKEVIGARAKARDICKKINPVYITGWADLKRKVDESSNDISSYLESKKDLP